MPKIETATPDTGHWERHVQLLRHMALAAETRDAYTNSHLERVGAYCRLLASAIGLPSGRVDVIVEASPFHDIGKIGIPASILSSPGPLTADERAVVQTHCVAGATLLAGTPLPVLQLAERIALTHHERWDGRGYPSRLRGEAIPIEGRICAVADVLDALTSRRCYKPAWTLTQALVHILSGSGSQFDSALVEAMMDTRTELNGIYRTFADSRPPGGWDGPAAVLRFPTVRQDIRDQCVPQPGRQRVA